MQLFSSLKSLVTGQPLSSFNYEIKDYYANSSVFSLYEGKSRATGKKCTIFKFETKDQPQDKILLAQYTLKRLKTIRHPSIIQFLE